MEYFKLIQRSGVAKAEKVASVDLDVKVIDRINWLRWIIWQIKFNQKHWNIFF